MIYRFGNNSPKTKIIPWYGGIDETDDNGCRFYKEVGIGLRIYNTTESEQVLSMFVFGLDDL